MARGQRIIVLPDETITLIEDAGRPEHYLHDQPLIALLASDYSREAPWRALQGEDDEATGIATASGAAVRVAGKHPRLIHAMRAVGGVDVDVAMEMSEHLPDLLVVDLAGGHVYSSWRASAGYTEYRFGLGGDVSICQDGMVVLPASMPETMLAAFPGRPLAKVVTHPTAFHGDETIAEVVPRRMYGGEWRNALRIGRAPAS